MSKYISRTFSRVFPAYHPKKGQPTYFVEKICNQFGIEFWQKLKYTNLDALNPDLDGSIIKDFNYSLDFRIKETKGHTIRGGHWFKPGDFLVPKVWSGKPYASKQIQFAPPIEIVKTWDFEIKDNEVFLNGDRVEADGVPFIANNDGLSFLDFMHWFKYPKPSGECQIICWNKSIDYSEI